MSPIPTYGKGGVEVIGGYLDNGAGSSGGGESVAVEVLDWGGNWSLGSAPNTVTVTLDGLQMPPGGFKTFLTPNSPKTLRIGDGQEWLELRNLWVETADPDQWNEGVAQIRVVLQDRRVWWSRRPPMGPRAYNIEQFTERQNPWISHSGGYGNNPRCDPATVRYAIDILREIMVYLGEDLSQVELDGNDGWVDLATVVSLSSQMSIWTDTPEFVLGDGASPIEALEKFMRIYGLTVGISPDTMQTGFLRESDIPSRLPATKLAIEDLMQRPLNPVEAGSVGYDREHLPDVIWINGSRIVIGDALVLEPVARDPDRPERFIPLQRLETLEAYGFDMSLPGRKHLDHGIGAIRFATAMASMSDPPSEMPPRFHSYLKEWFRIWQVAMPREMILEATWFGDEELGVLSRAERLIDDDVELTTGTVYRRWRSPVYRFQRTQNAGSFVSVGTVPSWTPHSFSTDGVVLGRFLPLLNHTEEIMSDGSYGKLRVYGANVLRAHKPRGSQGNTGFDWVMIGGIIDPDLRVWPDELADIGVEAGLLDPELGIVDLGEQVFGHNGTRAEATGHKRATERLAEEGATLLSLWKQEEQAALNNRESISPVGQAYLMLRCAFHKKSHGTARDFTTTFSPPPAGRADPLVASMPLVLTALQLNFVTGQSLIGMPADPSGTQSYPLNFYQHTLPDLELRCMTRRVLHLEFDSDKTMIPSAPSFHRAGGSWQSGELGGDCAYGDIDLGSLQRASGSGGDGIFCPVSQAHYAALWFCFNAILDRASTGIALFRSTENNIRCINAEVCGVHRAFFPGSSDFGQHPVDSIGFSGSGDGVNASMRIAANSRGWRPYVDSAVNRAMVRLRSLQTDASTADSCMNGGG